MKSLTQINFNRLSLWFFILFLNFLVIFKVNAVPPASPYLPGETLDPLCSPTTTNCTVAPPIVSLNNLITSTQFFSVTSTGNDFQIISTGSEHIFYLPDASLISRGLVSTGSQIFAGSKFFADSLGIGVTTSVVKFQVNGDSILATTSISFLTLTNPLALSSGGTGLSSLGSANQILGVNNSASGLEYKDIASLLNAGQGISINGTTTATISNNGVLSLNNITGTVSLLGTSNQINVATLTNNIILSLPQDINTSSSVIFRDLYLKNSLALDINIATLTTDIILTPGVDKMYQFLNIATTQITIYLATSTAKTGDSFIIFNISNVISSTSTIYVKQLGSSSFLDIITPYKKSKFTFVSTSWGLESSESFLHGPWSREYNFGLSIGVNAYSQSYGVSIGHSAYSNTSSNSIGFAVSSQNYSSAIGERSRAYNYGVSIGYQSGYNLDYLSSTANTLIGAYSGYQLTTGIGNIIIGYQSGYDPNFSPTVGSKNILIGFQAGTPATTTSNFLNIGNLIFATGINTATGSAVSSGNVAIGTTTPSERLTVQGNALVIGTSTLQAVIPLSNNLYDLGSASLQWRNLFVTTATINNSLTLGSNIIQGNNTTTIFVGSNSNQLVLGSNNNVGIGTNDPQYKLHVVGDELGLPNAIIAYSGNDRYLGLGGDWPYIDSYGAGARLLLNFRSTQDVDIRDGSLYVVGSSGNVGIGTTIPSERLTVQGNALITGNLTVYATSVLATTSIGSLNSNLLFTPQNNFLINILPSYSADTPGGDLTIQGATSSVTTTISNNANARGGDINIRGGNVPSTANSSARGGSINIIGGRGGNYFTSTSSPKGGSINIQSGVLPTPGDINIIVPSSTVGSGTINIITGDGSVFGSGGNINITAGNAINGSGGSVIITAGTSTNSVHGNIIFKSNTTELMRITTSSVAIGTTTPSQKLTVQGAILQTNALNCALSADATGKIICNVSSLKYKENIKPLSFDREKFLSLIPKEFEFKQNLSFSLPGKHIGFIAEEVAQQFPDLVRFSNDQPEGVKYENLSIYLYQLVKDFIINIKSYFVDVLKSFGLIIQENFLSIKQIATEKLTANYIISPKIKTEFLEMKDQLTGESYCVYISAGEFKKIKGDCSNALDLSTIDNSNSFNSNYNSGNSSSNIEDNGNSNNNQLQQGYNTSTTDLLTTSSSSVGSNQGTNIVPSNNNDNSNSSQETSANNNNVTNNINNTSADNSNMNNNTSQNDFGNSFSNSSNAESGGSINNNQSDNQSTITTNE